MKKKKHEFYLQKYYYAIVCTPYVLYCHIQFFTRVRLEMERKSSAFIFHFSYNMKSFSSLKFMDFFSVEIIQPKELQPESVSDDLKMRYNVEKVLSHTVPFPHN